MKAKVLISFTDKESKAIQSEGKVIELSEERFSAIMSVNDTLLEAVEAEDDAVVFPKHVGGGRYELSNGEKIKGKEAAIAAQAELDKQ